MAAAHVQHAGGRVGDVAGGGVHALRTVATDAGRVTFMIRQDRLHSIHGDPAPVLLHEHTDAVEARQESASELVSNGANCDVT